MKTLVRLTSGLALAACGGLGSASATLVEITVTNLAPTTPTGLYLSPVTTLFHNGSVDLYDPGTVASPAIERLAELGDGSGIIAQALATQPTAAYFVLRDPAGAGPGVISPGVSQSFTVDLNPSTQRYLSWGLMVVPSNDTFSANANPTGYELFDGTGAFTGAKTWTFAGTDTYQSFTEFDNAIDGGAFVAGVDPTTGTPDLGVITRRIVGDLSDTLGVLTPAGTRIGEPLTADPLFQISIEAAPLAAVPEPSTYGLLGAVGLAMFAVWKRRRPPHASTS